MTSVPDRLQTAQSAPSDAGSEALVIAKWLEQQLGASLLIADRFPEAVRNLLTVTAYVRALVQSADAHVSPEIARVAALQIAQQKVADDTLLRALQAHENVEQAHRRGVETIARDIFPSERDASDWFHAFMESARDPDTSVEAVSEWQRQLLEADPRSAQDQQEALLRSAKWFADQVTQQSAWVAGKFELSRQIIADKARAIDEQLQRWTTERQGRVSAL